MKFPVDRLADPQGPRIEMLDTVLTWLLKWFLMVPWNMGVVLRWYGLRAFRRGPERSALRATWDVNWMTRRPVIFRQKDPLDHPAWPAYISR